MEEEGEHCVVLHGLEWYPDVDLQRLSTFCCEECRQLVHLFVVLDDGSEPLCPRVFAEREEVLAQEVLWYETGAQLVQNRFQACGHSVGELNDVLSQDLHLNELFHVRDIVEN